MQTETDWSAVLTALGSRSRTRTRIVEPCVSTNDGSKQISSERVVVAVEIMTDRDRRSVVVLVDRCIVSERFATAAHAGEAPAIVLLVGV